MLKTLVRAPRYATEFCTASLFQLTLQGTLVWPGYWPGYWDGLAWDPDRQLVVTTIKRLATVVQLYRRGDLVIPSPDTELGLQHMPQ